MGFWGFTELHDLVTLVNSSLRENATELFFYEKGATTIRAHPFSPLV